MPWNWRLSAARSLVHKPLSWLAALTTAARHKAPVCVETWALTWPGVKSAGQHLPYQQGARTGVQKRQDFHECGPKGSRMNVVVLSKIVRMMRAEITLVELHENTSQGSMFEHESKRTTGASQNPRIWKLFVSFDFPFWWDISIYQIANGPACLESVS